MPGHGYGGAVAPAQRARRRRDLAIQAGWALIDATCWTLAVVASVYVRFDFSIDGALVSATLVVAACAAAAHLGFGILFGPYLVGHIRGSFEEVVSVSRAALMTGLALLLWTVMSFPSPVVPRSTPVMAGAFALVSMLAARLVVRAWRSRQAAKRYAEARTIVYGAGRAGRRLVHNMLFTADSAYRPVAIIDDDRRKRRLSYEGVRVRGGRHDIPAVAQRLRATQLVVAIPSADAELMREVNDIAETVGLQTKVLPTLNEMFSANPHVTDLRDLSMEDLLGRRAVRLDQEAIAEQLTGRIVLVTGASGSIGSELRRQIARFDPSRLLLLDRDGSALHATQLSLTGRGLLEGNDLLLADIRDASTLRHLFGEHRPDIVFHAAALKHLSLLQKYPGEGWQTNVVGTMNVLTAAAQSGVGTFVNISTDKAASPTSVLGYSKRIAERLTADLARSQPGRYVSVRFGNVIGSRGSVIPAFTEQIRRGGPVTVTHRDVERYFMLIPEACQLVMQAAAIGSDGEVIVLDMGTPVKIADVAATLISMSGRNDVEIIYTGLRPGEKLSEVLFMDNEPRRASAHPLLTAVDVPPLSPQIIREAHPGGRTDVMHLLRSYAGVTTEEMVREHDRHLTGGSS